ncbi:sortase [Microgenomates group bacterium]|nr:sortase [Microgenomates group bacterium]
MKINREDLIQAYREALRRDISVEQVLEEWDMLGGWGARGKVRKITKQIPFVLSLIIGLGFIFTALTPSFEYLWTEKLGFKMPSLISPVPDSQVFANHNSLLDNSSFASTSDTNPQTNSIIVVDDQTDYRNLANWFGSTDAQFNNHQQSRTNSLLGNSVYTLDIPKLNIAAARIRVGGTNLNSSLIQYETTVMPGETGVTSIFGHSTLRQWYNPSQNNPDRYMSIFSTIMTLEKGDKIYITHEGKLHTYSVINKENVKPSDTAALIGQEGVDGKILRLITCTPEGTTAMRGIITAVLVEE